MYNRAQSEYRALADISRSRYVVTATKLLHRLQICPIVHNYHSPKLHPGPCSSVGMWQETERQTRRRPRPLYILRPYDSHEI